MMKEYYQVKQLNVYDNIDIARFNTHETFETILKLPYLELLYLNSRIPKEEEPKPNKPS